MATRASFPSSATCATPRSCRSTRAPTRSSAWSSPRSCSGDGGRTSRALRDAALARRGAAVRGGAPESALLGRRARVAAANAVLANATLAHGLDFDDTREDAIVHTSCVAVTTALAAAEAAGASGRAMLEAVIAGVEVMCRVGLAVPGALHARHFHPTAIAGGFGAAAAAGRLYGLDEGQLVHAFGLVGSQASGIIEYL